MIRKEEIREFHIIEGKILNYLKRVKHLGEESLINRELNKLKTSLKKL
jgi:hypothetical protein